MKKIILTLCFVFIFSTVSFASSKSLQDLKRERDEINAKVNNTQSDINATQNLMYKTQLEIISLDEKLILAYDDLSVIEETLVGVVERLGQAEKDLAQAQEESDAQYEAYKERLRVMQIYGEANFIDVLFQATSVRDFLTRLQYLNDVAEHDQAAIERLKTAEGKVSRLVEEIAIQRNTIEEYKFRQTSLANEIEATANEKQKYLSTLQTDLEGFEAIQAIQKEAQTQTLAAYSKAEREYREMQAREAAIQAEQRRRAVANFNGSMTFPFPNYRSITDRYGNRVHPIRKTKDFHSGVDIAGASGSDILAAESGTVIFSGRNSGYGNYIIVDHGGGVSTLYAHASRLLFSEGAKVSRGQVIAKVGSTGISTGPHLHFEVRIYGEHTNPQKYLGY